MPRLLDKSHPGATQSLLVAKATLGQRQDYQVKIPSQDQGHSGQRGHKAKRYLARTTIPVLLNARSP